MDVGQPADYLTGLCLYLKSKAADLEAPSGFEGVTFHQPVLVVNSLTLESALTLLCAGPQCANCCWCDNWAQRCNRKGCENRRRYVPWRSCRVCL